MIGKLVFLPFDSRERHAVVRGDQDKRVVQLAALVEHREHAVEVRVEMLDLEGVIEDVVAHDFGVGPKGGKFLYFADVPAVLRRAGPVLVAAVRLEAAVPKAPRRAARLRIEKVAEVGGVVVAADARGGRGLLALREGRAGQLPGPAVAFANDAGRPALAGHAREVAVFGERLDIRRELFGKKRHMVARLFQLPSVAPGQDAGPRGRALGVGRIGPVKKHAFARHAVEARRIDPGRSVGAHVREGRVVGNGEEDIRALLGRGEGLAAHPQAQRAQAHVSQEISSIHIDSCS